MEEPLRLGHILLGRAFEVLTMERFSYWATLLALPFVGLLAAELVDRYRTAAVVGLEHSGGLYLRTGSGMVNLPACGMRRDFKVDSVAAMAEPRRP